MKLFKKVVLWMAKRPQEILWSLVVKFSDSIGYTLGPDAFVYPLILLSLATICGIACIGSILSGHLLWALVMVIVSFVFAGEGCNVIKDDMGWSEDDE